MGVNRDPDQNLPIKIYRDVQGREVEVIRQQSLTDHVVVADTRRGPLGMVEKDLGVAAGNHGVVVEVGRRGVVLGRDVAVLDLEVGLDQGLARGAVIPVRHEVVRVLVAVVPDPGAVDQDPGREAEAGRRAVAVDHGVVEVVHVRDRAVAPDQEVARHAVVRVHVVVDRNLVADQDPVVDPDDHDPDRPDLGRDHVQNHDPGLNHVV